MVTVDRLLELGASTKRYYANEIIFEEGTECYHYYQLVSGSVRWLQVSEDGKEFVQDMIEPGECFGEFPLFDGRPYAASAIASTESKVLRLPKVAFQQLLKDDPDLHFAFSKLLVERLRFRFLFSKNLASNKPEDKICSLLTYFKEQKKYICNRCNLVKLTRQQIADMTGLRVETVIRSIRHLQEIGKLQINKGKVFY
jgi:CRP/FNR family transcriptional regulator, cyclic AMP receptor protein